MSMSQGIFPTCLKNAVVTPLIKNVILKDDLKNYCPIYGSFISKLVVVLQIKTHFEVSN
jgi:hypothetical protein